MTDELYVLPRGKTLNMAGAREVVEAIDSVRLQGKVAVVELGGLRGITSFACRQLLKRANEDDMVKFENVPANIESALKLHGEILKEEQQ